MQPAPELTLLILGVTPTPDVGTTVVVEFGVIGLAGTLVAPDEAPGAAILDADGAAVGDATVSLVETGRYRAAWASTGASQAAYGVALTATVGGYVLHRYESSLFTLTPGSPA